MTKKRVRLAKCFALQMALANTPDLSMADLAENEARALLFCKALGFLDIILEFHRMSFEELQAMKDAVLRGEVPELPRR